MATCFISDLHLQPSRPDIGEQFFEFLHTSARQADALYILGDLFDTWIGDDDPDPYFASVQDALRALCDAGVPGYFMHGNRDFMVGDGFSHATGFTLLPDPTVIQLHGSRVLLSHGDALCTDDQDYQAFRRMVRDPAWQAQMLVRPVTERRAIAAAARAESLRANAGKEEYIMDVNQDAVADLLQAHKVLHLLHGHTHRPAVHRFDTDAGPATRMVLGDWYEQGSLLSWDADGPDLQVLPRR